MPAVNVINAPEVEPFVSPERAQRPRDAGTPDGI